MTTVGGRRTRLREFDYLRAVAIITIVISHSYRPWAINSFGEDLLANILTGGSALFVFVSGFFFAWIDLPDFGYEKFLLKKGRSVVAPFLIIGSTLFAWWIATEPPTPTTGSSFLNRVAGFPGALWRGQVPHGYQLWYIPFISILFLLSPLFVRYARWSPRARTAVMLGLFAISLLIHRSERNASPLQSALYFAPVYLAGINFSLDRPRLDQWLTGKAIPLGIGVLLIATLHTAFAERGNFEKAPWVWGGIDLMLVQKAFLIPLIYLGCRRLQDRVVPGLTLLADASFCIFFLHWAVIDAVWSTGVVQQLPITGLGQTALLAIFGVYLSLGIGYAVRRLAGSHSRLLTGW
jgi:peptidoglycan/LPS O-acetylase OafA/YrhL